MSVVALATYEWSGSSAQDLGAAAEDATESADGSASANGSGEEQTSGSEAGTPPGPGLDGSTGNPNGGDAAADAADAATPMAPSSAIGMWVWKEDRTKATDGTYGLTRTITEDDLTWKVGPSGWPGCPQGISCLHYGNRVFLADAQGRYHVMNRVTTGSDFQNFGSFTDNKDGLLTLTREQDYSCAHPLADITKYPKPGTLYARYRIVGADLWLSPFGAKSPPRSSSIARSRRRTWRSTT